MYSPVPGERYLPTRGLAMDAVFGIRMEFSRAKGEFESASEKGQSVVGHSLETDGARSGNS